MPRLTCVLARYRALDACASLLSRSGLLTRRRARTGGDAAPDDVAGGVVVCPYYRSAFGKKYVAGEPVEEGEAGPARSSSRSCPSSCRARGRTTRRRSSSASAAAGASTVSVRVLADSGVDEAEGGTSRRT